MDLAGWSLAWVRDDDKTSLVNKANVPRFLGSPSKALDLIFMAAESAGKVYGYCGIPQVIRGLSVHLEGALRL